MMKWNGKGWEKELVCCRQELGASVLYRFVKSGVESHHAFFANAWQAGDVDADAP
jgi:hypothetical protein